MVRLPSSGFSRQGGSGAIGQSVYWSQQFAAAGEPVEVRYELSEKGKREVLTVGGKPLNLYDG